MLKKFMWRSNSRAEYFIKDFTRKSYVLHTCITHVLYVIILSINSILVYFN